MGSLGKALKRFDLNPATDETFQIRTTTGAVISVITIIIMSLLFWGEFKLFINYRTTESMVIDKETKAKTNITFSITFDYLPCDMIQVGYRDALGNDRDDIESSITKVNLDVNGNPIGAPDKSKVMITAPTKEEVLENTRHEDDIVIVDEKKECGDCFGAREKPACCNTCEDVIQAYREKKWDVSGILTKAPQCAGFNYLNKWKNGVERGCTLNGVVSVTKVQGHVFVVPGRINELMSMAEIRQIFSSLNVTHTIHSLSLGEPILGQKNPFNERRGVMSSDHTAMYQYFVNAIPTTYTDRKGKVTNTYQITETHHIRPLQDTSSLIPGVYFVYEFSPLRAVIEETHLPLFELCTSLCAILGGVFTVMGMIDGFVYSLLKTVKRHTGAEEPELSQRMISKDD